MVLHVFLFCKAELSVPVLMKYKNTCGLCFNDRDRRMRDKERDKDRDRGRKDRDSHRRDKDRSKRSRCVNVEIRSFLG